jgi:hypothetical protein
MITIKGLKDSIANLNYKWFDDQINLIAIRTNLQVPDVFNDVMCVVYKKGGVEVLETATITTEPGVAYQKKLLNKDGCYVMMPAQMINAYKLGLHQGKADHRCLKSVGKIYGLRDKDLDGIAGNSGTAMWFEGKTVGANIHGSNKLTKSNIIGSWSAGCQVYNEWKKKEALMGIADLYDKVNNGLITYTLIKESDYKA